MLEPETEGELEDEEEEKLEELEEMQVAAEITTYHPQLCAES